jgi:hypothetical protein
VRISAGHQHHQLVAAVSTLLVVAEMMRRQVPVLSVVEVVGSEEGHQRGYPRTMSVSVGLDRAKEAAAWPCLA